MKHKRLFEYQVTEFFLSNHHVTGDAQEIEYVCPFYVLVVTIKLFLAFTH